MSKLPEKVGTAAVESIFGPLARNPHRVGKALRFELSGLRTARRGDFRIIYRITDFVTIVVSNTAPMPTASGDLPPQQHRRRTSH
ncbi:MAG: type II toxin-antitoxin system RelE family toxin [Ornithinimicrobium sp.]|uniref:type II toxin-antitoxin system RelE family toxin n=1 Tax=Ornithinimicrobium sp. TaxID=1977084 RepID=UPI003D9B02BE